MSNDIESPLGLLDHIRLGSEPTVTKVGPYDGHLTNSAAYNDDQFEGPPYRPW
ncbi:hypothetical protein [Winogradskya humida]|uniref:hypothetical protein n=1 Tax=Winogradskya humida TaxID=113566 RepID=UPI001940B2AC|nr:hypothetical protein [Actinoplanes humidus]